MKPSYYRGKSLETFQLRLKSIEIIFLNYLFLFSIFAVNNLMKGFLHCSLIHDNKLVYRDISARLKTIAFR